MHILLRLCTSALFLLFISLSVLSRASTTVSLHPPFGGPITVKLVRQTVQIDAVPYKVNYEAKQLLDLYGITVLSAFNVHGSVHRNNILVYNSNQVHKSQSLFYLKTALHVSGVTITHLQEHKTTVTTASGNSYTVLLSAAIVEELELI